MVGQQAEAMANPEHLAKLREGIEAWEKWKKGNDLSQDAKLSLSLQASFERMNPDLSGANLDWINAAAADLSHARLGGASLNHAVLQRANLLDADLTEAHANNADFLEADLRNARFARGQLTKAMLRNSRLENADFTSADLSRADLRGANLDGAILSGANLEGVRAEGASLRRTLVKGASLRGADFGRALFRGTDLDGSDLTDVLIGRSIFVETSLVGVKGLASVKHYAPSSVDVDTLLGCQGDMPEVFLRGCGIPEDFITSVRSFTSKSIEFYSCFISYSTKDQAFADRLYADLQNKGVRCWFAPHDVQGGKKLHEQIDEAIRLHDKLLLILSPHSMASEWVKTEIAKARKREVRDQRRVLFPIRLAPFETLRDWECFDADTGKDSAREIREYFIPDFSNWKDHDSYQEAFQRLISDLKASDTKPK
jgi:uncharacterized protein YjbI with pentapeptide repeats